MIRDFFQVNTGLYLTAKPLCGKRSAMHVTIISVIRASRLEGESLL